MTRLVWMHQVRPWRRNAGPGRWDQEPDKAQWIDPETELDCLAVRNPDYGAWCGYVGVPPGHRLHGVGYDDATDTGGDDLAVHGGLTYSDGCQEDAAEGHGICHVPEPGRPADVWWLGFDCAHYRDLVPGMGGLLTISDGVYRDLAYVQRECTALARQIGPA